jgi:hypothetical protein
LSSSLENKNENDTKMITLNDANPISPWWLIGVPSRSLALFPCVPSVAAENQDQPRNIVCHVKTSPGSTWRWWDSE